ncbi:MAG: Fis family transcriptional regulator [Acidobacteria bacterium]|nr:MAG: Fis family transcriptional regulator [Acidobacteriota bacterium]
MSIASQTGPSLANRYEALFRVSQALGSQRDPKELFRVLENELRRVVTSEFVSFFLYDEVANKMCPRGLHLVNRPAVPVPCDVAPEETMTWWVYQHQEPLVIPSVGHETRFPGSIECLKKQSIQSACALPLKTVHRRLGCLVCGSKRPDAFTEEEIGFLSLVADQVALAVDDALNFNASQVAQAELQQERDRLKLVLDLSNSLVSNLELRDLLRAISASVRRVMRCEAVGVVLPDSESSQLRLYALDFPESKGFALEEGKVVPETSPANKAFRTGEPLTLLNPQGRLAAAEGIKSNCFLPLISRNRILGVLGLGRLQEEPFTREDVDFLSQVAGQAAIAVENALAYRQIADLKDRLAQEKLYLEDEIRSEMNFEEIVGESSALRQALQQVETVAPTDSTVLILGEIPTGLLESELFGHEKGAFTGAISQKIGRLELADQGTLFLDEVGDIPLELQPKLLRALQEREFERLGNAKTKKVDVRLVAATHQDLQTMVADHQFRGDLYYRLNVFPIRIPPLRERPEDIPLLVRHFTQKYARRMDRRIETIPSNTMNKLRRWHWPGNVRELENFIERAVILTRNSVLNVPVSELTDGPWPTAGIAVSGSAERDQIVRVLKDTEGRVGGPNGAAARLGLKRTTLISRMKKLGINPAEVS